MSKEQVFFNRIVDKKQLKSLMSWAYTNYGSASSAQMADHLKEMGFRYATRAGVSISIDDLQVPPIKRKMLEEAEAEIKVTESRYSKGEITEVERFQKVIDTWNSTSEALKDEVVTNFRTTNPLNSVYMMAFSGARGNLSQVRQLVGMRGLMANPQGEIIDLPIKTNFREGLTVTEYIISSYGARKGLVDTALRTADSGYLTRRLVDVSQDVIVREIDCGTQRSIGATSMRDGERVLIPLAHRLLGRVLAEDVVDQETGEVVAQRNQIIDHDLADKIGAVTDNVMVRSPLTCEAARSVCQTCYGWSLAHGYPVDLGEAVGIIAAQSIGEPGTQLTMRTFHTGGVFTGEVAQQIRAPFSGKVEIGKKLRTRVVRTSHGDEREQVEVAGDLTIKPNSGGKSVSKTYNLTPGSRIWVKHGDTVTEGEMLVELAAGKKARSTERAAKDVASDITGEVLFDKLAVEEKTDRQGNTTRNVVRGGLLWVLSGDVYNLPTGAEPVVKNGDEITPETVIAETKLSSVAGGIVRLSAEEDNRNIDIVNSSVQLDQALVRRESNGGREQYVIETEEGQRYLLKVAPGAKVIDQQIIGELIDERYHTNTGGMVKYAGIEVGKKSKGKQGYEVIQGGTLVWIPEECHEVNKDLSLLNVEDGQYVEGGTEVVKDVFCQTSGVVEVVQKNDILREIVIKPGDLHLLEGGIPKDAEPRLVQAGEEVIPGVVPPELCYADYLETPSGAALLLRPVVEYNITNEPETPQTSSLNQKVNREIKLAAVQRLFYKDGERVKSVEGLELMRTQLTLEIGHQENEEKSDRANLAADLELVPLSENEEDADKYSLQLVCTETLVLRRDRSNEPHSGGTKNRVLVKDGDEIAPGAVVARTEIQCKESGEVRGIREGVEAIRRVLVVREGDRLTIPIEGETKVKKGDLLVAGSELASGIFTEESGQVVKVEPSQVTLRLARPYRVSPGAVLHIDDGDLVQRGDHLVLLVFERAKTGDIIQGLPRIEELLEGRKPKEACILARLPGVAQVVYDEDDVVDVKVIEEDGTIADYPLRPGQNALVSDGQQVQTGTPLTDGPANPHEILEIFFNYHLEEHGVYEAALLGLQQAQAFLVNEVQSVYQSQGIDISDKHIEVIVRQMTSKVRVDDGGDTTTLPGELVELRQIEQVNEAMSITGSAPARYTPVLLGITKASLNTDSFISAASFQETTRVLTEAAIEGKSDWLRGLKENVIIGRLIPAGTGFNQHSDESLNPPMETDQSIASAAVYPYGSVGDGGANIGNQDPMDVVLDDRTARAYTRSERPFSKEGFNAVIDDESIGNSGWGTQSE